MTSFQFINEIDYKINNGAQKQDVPDWNGKRIKYLMGPISFTIMKPDVSTLTDEEKKLSIYDKIIYLIGDSHDFSTKLDCGINTHDSKTSVYVTKFLKQILEYNKDNKQNVIDIFVEDMSSIRGTGMTMAGTISNSAIFQHIRNDFKLCYEQPRDCNPYYNIRWHYADYRREMDVSDLKLKFQAFDDLKKICDNALNYSIKEYTSSCHHVQNQLFIDNIDNIYNKIILLNYITADDYKSYYNIDAAKADQKYDEMLIEVGKLLFIFKRGGILEPDTIFNAMLNYHNVQSTTKQKKALKSYNSIISTKLKQKIRDFFINEIKRSFDQSLSLPPPIPPIPPFNDIYKLVFNDLKMPLSETRNIMNAYKKNNPAFEAISYAYGTMILNITTYVMDIYLISRLCRTYVKRFPIDYVEMHNRIVNRAIIIAGGAHINNYKNFLKTIGYTILFEGKSTYDSTDRQKRQDTRCVDFQNPDIVLTPLNISKLVHMEQQTGGFEHIFEHHVTSNFINLLNDNHDKHDKQHIYYTPSNITHTLSDIHDKYKYYKKMYQDLKNMYYR
jgi:hypothetical protein